MQREKGCRGRTDAQRRVAARWKSFTASTCAECGLCGRVITTPLRGLGHTLLVPRGTQIPGVTQPLLSIPAQPSGKPPGSSTRHRQQAL